MKGSESGDSSSGQETPVWCSLAGLVNECDVELVVFEVLITQLYGNFSRELELSYGGGGGKISHEDLVFISESIGVDVGINKTVSTGSGAGRGSLVNMEL